jgi:hypothetical protein
MDFEPNRTQFLQKQKRTRARITLPLEMAMFSLLLVNALCGGLGFGLIGKLIAEQGASNGVAGISLPVSLGGVCVALVEWALGERWLDEPTRRACIARVSLGLAAIGLWGFLASLILQAGGQVFPALGAALVAMIFHGWSGCCASAPT